MFQDEPNVDEIKAWLLQIEKKLDILGAMPIDQLSEQHFDKCKVSFNIKIDRPD